MSFSIGYSCRADSYKIPAQQKALDVGSNAMTFKIFITTLTIGLIFSCRPKTDKSSLKNLTLIHKILPDTSKNLQAKDEFESFTARKVLAQRLGLPDIEKSNDSLEMRVWWQASIYSPSTVWLVHVHNDSLTATQIDYFPNSQQNGGFDSIHKFSKVPTSGNWKKYLEAIDLPTFWKIPFQYEMPGRYGCVDGENVTVEMFDRIKYKSVTYRCYTMYRDSSTYGAFTSLVDKITALK